MSIIPSLLYLLSQFTWTSAQYVPDSHRQCPPNSKIHRQLLTQRSTSDYLLGMKKLHPNLTTFQSTLGNPEARIQLPPSPVSSSTPFLFSVVVPFWFSLVCYLRQGFSVCRPGLPVLEFTLKPTEIYLPLLPKCKS